MIYRRGLARAFAVGFLLFAFGVPISHSMLVNYPSQGSGLGRSWSGRLGAWLFSSVLHSDVAPRETVRSGRRVTVPPKYNREDFIRIVHCGIVTLLGILGGIIAQLLYATRRAPSPPQNTP
jgi:hypothetical protein